MDNHEVINKEQYIEVLEQFRKAYFDLLSIWHDDFYAILTNMDINSLYPFSVSFDELNIPEWIDELISNLEDKEAVYSYVREFWGEEVEKKFRKEY